MRRLLACLVLSALALPRAARAEGSFQLTAGAGVATPFGDVGDGVKLTDSINWAFPLEARVAYRLGKEVALGAYGRWAPTAVSSGCPGCTVTDLGLGLLVEYHFGEKAEAGPWLGASGGWERLDTTVRSSTVSATGFEAAASGGYDFELGGVSVGPYGQLSLGGYTSTSPGGAISSKGVHGLLGLGVRVSLLL